jgi:hypothetical protein
MPFTINTAYTLGEVLKAKDPQGRLHHLYDPFMDKRPILEEGFWTTANDPVYHEMLRVTSRPSGYKTRVNKGYTREGVGTAPHKEQLTSLGSLFELDKRLSRGVGNIGAWRAQRAQVHIRGMLSNFNRLFWTDANTAADPDAVDGILTRYTPPTLSAMTASAYTNVIACDGTVAAECFPVVVVKWGIDGVQLLNPPGEATTFVEDDRGEVELEDADNLPFVGWRSYFTFNYGIGVADDQCVQRLINVEWTDIKADAHFEEYLIQALEQIPNGLDNTAVYCGRQIHTGIMQRINSKANVNYSMEQVFARQMPTIMGVPIIRDDALSTAEAVIS